MESLISRWQDDAPRILVRAGGVNAECPRCEACHFVAIPDPTMLACGSCGADISRAALVQQLDTAARLIAEALAAQAAAPRLPIPD